LVFGWAACLLGGCAYGVLRQGFGSMILPDAYGLEGLRFATQIAGLIQSFVLFVAFWFLRKRWPFAGAAFLMFCLFYFTGQFFLEGYRGDEALYVGPLRLTQIVDLAIALLAAVGLLVLWSSNRRAVQEFEELEAPEDGLIPEPMETEPAAEFRDAEPPAGAEEEIEDLPAYRTS
jgi:prolipoprotein diacylglyceryltransferase